MVGPLIVLDPMLKGGVVVVSAADVDDEVVVGVVVGEVVGDVFDVVAVCFL